MHYAQFDSMQSVSALHSPAGLCSYKHGMTFGPKVSIKGPVTNSPYVVKIEHGSFGDVTQLELMLGAKVWRQASAGEQWKRHVFNSNAAADVDALTETVEAGLDYIAEFGSKSLALTGLRAHDVQCEHLAALLRATSTWRNEIPGWYQALTTAKLAVELARLDPEDVLFGMI